MSVNSPPLSHHRFPPLLEIPIPTLHRDLPSSYTITPAMTTPFLLQLPATIDDQGPPTTTNIKLQQQLHLIDHRLTTDYQLQFSAEEVVNPALAQWVQFIRSDQSNSNLAPPLNVLVWNASGRAASPEFWVEFLSILEAQKPSIAVIVDTRVDLDRGMANQVSDYFSNKHMVPAVNGSGGMWFLCDGRKVSVVGSYLSGSSIAAEVVVIPPAPNRIEGGDLGSLTPSTIEMHVRGSGFD